ncbi:MAG: urease accessory protein [Rhodospirillaceae bacterium]|jgi:ABC-type nickel/cobalt efflux system permease component RcnA|nr:urease accessory protein [Rhodospirillaceae bacterium]MBT4490465.1 urease accessory protein [Rhodospirillaceae bacterium]MBT5195556.1 urease accessory protein [Rhodospirillaceae bacterium]MBT5897739.1 urease accessory protein [Rhodospirillaceae bacterium]MBT7760006.1 urease accessory protein [Rhodospirillaceae bacterium]
MFTVIGLGFLLGLQHAMEADHVAAVAAMAAGRKKLRHVVHHGLFWGLGHALALGAFASMVIAVRGNIPKGLGAGLEFAVAIMLIVLGVMVVWRVLRERLHFHIHRHADGKVHFHAHRHAGERRTHDENRHEHEHGKNNVRRSLLVGVMHGLAGSAALIALAAPGQWLQGAGFVMLFGAGSILGMVLLSSVIALPLVLSGRLMTGLNRSLQLGIGLISIGLGGFHATGQLPDMLSLL